MKILMHPTNPPQGLYQIVIAAVITIDPHCETLLTSERYAFLIGISKDMSLSDRQLGDGLGTWPQQLRQPNACMNSSLVPICRILFHQNRIHLC